ncbi:uncharacterized protein N7469_008915 [Penicillium citrinum]|uniref:MARVEL domain-containing protein n=2 Tax=Penicillium TaxID=5073 RepID=A0A9W9NML5_PENCI|nr:uncharacterized protein N7469_008915 [Penicillium citrinum]KAJ5222675.1 hypothetical protein N7469_008915 [Penicillium citrinum]KAJ5580832.1 hypothetical protein N7450_007133 [Penicillium hetheringtonii]
MAEIVNFHHHPLGLVGWIARVLQLISSIIVLGITAWATRDTKTVTVIFTLVISVLTLVVVACSTLTSCLTRRHKWHALILIMTDGVLSYLRWLTSFIFLALDFNRISCRVIRWNGETVCSRKYTAEAFSFIALYVILFGRSGAMNLYWNSFTTVLGLLMEILYIYYFKPKVIHEKNDAPPEQRLAQNLNEAGLM